MSLLTLSIQDFIEQGDLILDETNTDVKSPQSIKRFFDKLAEDEFNTNVIITNITDEAINEHASVFADASEFREMLMMANAVDNLIESYRAFTNTYDNDHAINMAEEWLKPFKSYIEVLRAAQYEWTLNDMLEMSRFDVPYTRGEPVYWHNMESALGYFVEQARQIFDEIGEEVTNPTDGVLELFTKASNLANTTGLDTAEGARRFVIDITHNAWFYEFRVVFKLGSDIYKRLERNIEEAFNTIYRNKGVLLMVNLKTRSDLFITVTEAFVTNAVEELTRRIVTAEVEEQDEVKYSDAEENPVDILQGKWQIDNVLFPHGEKGSNRRGAKCNQYYLEDPFYIKERGKVLTAEPVLTSLIHAQIYPLRLLTVAPKKTTPKDYETWPVTGTSADMNIHCAYYSMLVSWIYATNPPEANRKAAITSLGQLIFDEKTLGLVTNSRIFAKLIQLPIFAGCHIKLTQNDVNSIKTKYYPAKRADREGRPTTLHIYYNADLGQHYYAEVPFRFIGKLPDGLRTNKAKEPACYIREGNTTTSIGITAAIRFMKNMDMFKPISAEMHKMNPDRQLMDTMHQSFEDCLAVIDVENEPGDKFKPPKLTAKDMTLAFADLETYSPNNIGQQYAYQGCFEAYLPFEEGAPLPEPKTFIFTEKDATRRFCEHLRTYMTMMTTKTMVLYFHNMKFDISFLLNDLVSVLAAKPCPVTKDNVIYQVSFNVKVGEVKKRLIIRDSYRMIGMQLSRFPRAFGIEAEKEWLPYEYFNYHLRFDEGTGRPLPLIYCINMPRPQMGGWEEPPAEVVERARELGMLTPKGIDLIKWSEYYCKKDVRILALGMFKFAQTIRLKTACKRITAANCIACDCGHGKPDDHIDKIRCTPINIFNYLTISSLAEGYMLKMGVFEGMVKINGNCQVFIGKCVKGGICGTLDDMKIEITENLTDLDANSLYPSAMVLMDGYPLGRVVSLEHFGKKHTWERYPRLKHNSKGRAFWARCRFTKVLNPNPFNHLPITSRKIDGKIVYDCLPNTDYYLDYNTLNDVVKYGCVEPDDIEIVCGYMAEGLRGKIVDGMFVADPTGEMQYFNPKVRDVISYLYETRNEMKKEKNPCQEVIKLLMNSSYGKTCLKPSTEKKEVKTKTEILRYIATGSVTFKSAEPFCKAANDANLQYYIMRSRSSKLDHANYAHAGSLVLSFSKSIMNRSRHILAKIGAKLNYIDTDSLHFPHKALGDYQKEYIRTYGEDPIGNGLGQFKVDYDSPAGLGGPVETVAVTGHFLGRKAYAVKLQHSGLDSNGNPKVMYTAHARMKGIPNNILPKKVDEVMALYKKMYDGHTHEFDLCKDGDRVKPRLSVKPFAKGGPSVALIDDFTRKCQFLGRKHPPVTPY